MENSPKSCRQVVPSHATKSCHQVMPPNSPKSCRHVVRSCPHSFSSCMVTLQLHKMCNSDPLFPQPSPHTPSPGPQACSLDGVGNWSSVASNRYANSECHLETSCIAASHFIHSPKYLRFVTTFTTNFSSCISLKTRSIACLSSCCADWLRLAIHPHPRPTPSFFTAPLISSNVTT